MSAGPTIIPNSSLPPSTVLKTGRPRRAAGLVVALAATLALAFGCGGSTESQLAEVRALQEAGQFEPSIAPLRKLLASESGNAEANYRLGVALVQTGRPSLAVWPLKKASENDGYAVQAGLLLASTLLANNAAEEAIRAATRVLEIEPDNVTALLTRAHAHLGAGAPDKVIEDAERVLAIRPDDPSVVMLRAGALIDLDRNEEAEEALMQMAEESAKGTDANDAARKCAALATFYRERKSVEIARETFEKCAVKYPNHALLQQMVSDFYVETGASEEATNVWRRAVEATPEDLNLRSKLADLLYGQGKDEEAEAVLREAVELFDTDAAWRMLASFYRKSGDPKQAREALEQAMERQRVVSAPMQFALADMLIEEGDLDRAEEIAAGLTQPSYQLLLQGAILLAKEQPEQALEKFEAGLRLWPNNAGARYLAGRAASAMGDRDRAISEYREAVRVGETETDAALRLAEIYFSLGQFKPAGQFADRHIKKRSYETPNAHIIAARSATTLGQYERAEGILLDLKAKDRKSVVPFVEMTSLKRKTDGSEAAIAFIKSSDIDFMDAANSDALRELASDYITVGQDDAALALTAKAAAANPDSAPVLDTRARVLSRVGRTEQALAVADSALKVDPAYAPAIETKGRLTRRAGDLAAAIALFEQASAADPSAGEYVYLQAQTRMMNGETERGIELLRATLEVSPAHVGANNDLAWLIASNDGDLDEALLHAKRAVRADRSADTLDTLGYVHLKKGDNDEAVGVLAKALEARPDSPSIEYRLGVALAAKGDREQARAILTKALAAPAFPEAEEARKELAKLQDS